MLQCRYALGLLACLVLPSLVVADAPVEHAHGVVVSVSRPASEAGLTILQQGGSAVDAAVATAFALAVTHPAAGNIGGGGFMVVHPPKGKPTVIEYRETAPAAANKTMFLKDDSLYGPRVAGVPGTVRGMALAHQQFGKLPWKTVVMPAVRLAQDGFTLDAHQANSINNIVTVADDFPELRRVFGRADGKRWKTGDRLMQPDLAKTLRMIAEDGADAFYSGPVADLIVAEMKTGGGVISKEDLAGYKAIQREPIHGVYRGYDVYGPPPPSSGGICLVQMLNLLIYRGSHTGARLEVLSPVIFVSSVSDCYEAILRRGEILYAASSKLPGR